MRLEQQDGCADVVWIQLEDAARLRLRGRELAEPKLRPSQPERRTRTLGVCLAELGP
jgi:hypothetical protein